MTLPALPVSPVRFVVGNVAAMLRIHQLIFVAANAVLVYHFGAFFLNENNLGLVSQGENRGVA
tara:strand:- start:995 stop:1183 length:189 start_codon:yes stop_codon:yes gene_type:complete